MLEKLLTGIQHFRTHEYQEQKESYTALAHGQSPDTLFITCADSRIIPALITHTQPGNLFVARNVGAIIPLPDLEPSSEAAAIEYAVKVLSVKEIIVCGHSFCGAMKGLQAADLEEQLPAVATWLADTRKMLQGHLGENVSLSCTTKESILVQIENLQVHSTVAERLAEGSLTLHGFVYEFESGQVQVYNPKTKQFLSPEEDRTLSTPLKKGISHFKNRIYPQKKELYAELAQGQHPKALLFTCSDSRLSPSSFLHAAPGDLFIARNVGNIIPPYSNPSSEAAAIEYALEALDIKDLIICGHADCGAMKGLLNPKLVKSLPAVASWLTHAKATLSKIKAKSTEEDLVCATKENILTQIENLKTHPSVIKKLAANELTLHAWFYDFVEGEVYMYDVEQETFITFDEAVQQFILSESSLVKMQNIVQKEALAYLKELASPLTADEYKQRITLFNKIRAKDLSMIWDEIRSNVQVKLWPEFSELCANNEEDERFIALLEKGSAVKFNQREIIMEELMQSAGYRQFCNRTLRTFQKPSPRLQNEPQRNTSCCFGW
jgi:carbonic anhydrase